MTLGDQSDTNRQPDHNVLTRADVEAIGGQIAEEEDIEETEALPTAQNLEARELFERFGVSADFFETPESAG